MDLKELAAAYQAAEAAGDLDGCAACLIEAIHLAVQHPELEGTQELRYFEDGRLLVLIAAAIFAMERGENQLAAYFFSNVPQDILESSAWFPECWGTLGRLQARLGNAAEGTACFARHFKRYPDDEAAWFQLGNLRYHAGEYLSAIRAYRRALGLRRSFSEAEENCRQAMRMMLEGAGAKRLPIKEEIDGKLPLRSEDWEAVRKIPIFINCRDRVEILSKLVAWLLEAGYRNIILLDNASTYPLLLRYYEGIRSERVRVVRLGENLGYRALWDSGMLELLSIDTPYVYTDPDVLPGDACPPRFLQDFLRVFEVHPLISKVGAALAYKDICCIDSEKKIANEKRFYRVPLGGDAWYGNVDTTFALYRGARFYHRAPAVRMAGKFQWRHLPWYYDEAHLPEDEQYYLAHATTASSLKATLQQKAAEEQQTE